jgi:hypothetical protein
MNRFTIGFKIFLLYLIFYTSSLQAQEASNAEVSKNIIQSMDTLFRPAANSTNFRIISNSDLERLKVGINSALASKVNGKAPVSILRVDTVYLESKVSQDSPSNAATRSSDYSTLWMIAALLFMVISLVLLVIGFKSRRTMKDSLDRLNTLEADFERHKTNSVNRERKLMRDLIDARNVEE